MSKMRDRPSESSRKAPDGSAGGNASVEEALRYRLEFESLVTGISTKFINLALDEIDCGLNSALQTIGEFAGVDRSYVFLLSEDGKTIRNTHEWCAHGIEPQIDNLQDLPVEAIPWWMENLRRFEVIHVPRVADLPTQAGPEREILETQGIKSVVVVPIIYRRALRGFLGFDSVRAQKTWCRDSIALLQVVGEIVVGALERKKAEEKLRVFEKAVEQSIDGIAVIDMDGVVQSANRSWLDMHGYADDDVSAFVGKHFSIFHTEEQYKKDVVPFLERMEESGCHQDEVGHMRKDDTTFPTWMTVTTLRDEAGNPLGRVGIARDTTEHKRAEAALRESEQTLAQAQRIARVGSWIWDLTTNTVKWSHEMYRIFGIEPREFDGTMETALSIVHPDDRARVREITGRASQDERSVPLEYRIVRPDGSERRVWTEASFYFDEAGKAVRMIGIVQDITDRGNSE